MLAASGPLGLALLEPDAIEVGQLVEVVVEALGDGRFLVLPHPEVAGYASGRAEDPDAWLERMNGVQRRIADGVRGAR